MQQIKVLTPLFLVLAWTSVLAGPTEDFNALLDEAWEWRLSENPVFASRLGDRRNNDRWTDLSIDAFERRNEQQQDFLRRLRAIDSSTLAEADQLRSQLDHDRQMLTDREERLAEREGAIPDHKQVLAGLAAERTQALASVPRRSRVDATSFVTRALPWRRKRLV